MKTAVSTERYRVIRLEPEERFQHRRPHTLPYTIKHISVDTIEVKGDYFLLGGVNSAGKRVTPNMAYESKYELLEIPEAIRNEVDRCLRANARNPQYVQVEEFRSEAPSEKHRSKSALAKMLGWVFFAVVCLLSVIAVVLIVMLVPPSDTVNLP